MLDHYKLAGRDRPTILPDAAVELGSHVEQILILVGIGGLMANVVALLAAPLMTTVALLWRIHVEERAMAEHFGAAYEEYRKTTWRLLPLVW